MDILYILCDIYVIFIDKVMRQTLILLKLNKYLLCLPSKIKLVMTSLIPKLKTNGMVQRILKKIIYQTSVGWNSELGTICASYRWWKKIIQISY